MATPDEIQEKTFCKWQGISAYSETYSHLSKAERKARSEWSSTDEFIAHGFVGRCQINPVNGNVNLFLHLL
jgi:hypothetical protein